jgi:hypothetical protein
MDLELLLPMSPEEGPPLPRLMNIYWPWYEKNEYISVTIFGSEVHYEIAGFEPNYAVTLKLSNGSTFMTTADSTGSGSGSFYVTDPGNYTISAKDSFGHSAYASFTIT